MRILFVFGLVSLGGFCSKVPDDPIGDNKCITIRRGNEKMFALKSGIYQGYVYTYFGSTEYDDQRWILEAVKRGPYKDQGYYRLKNKNSYNYLLPNLYIGYMDTSYQADRPDDFFKFTLKNNNSEYEMVSAKNKAPKFNKGWGVRIAYAPQNFTIRKCNETKKL
jgi:hypothetical protein